MERIDPLRDAGPLRPLGAEVGAAGGPRAELPAPASGGAAFQALLEKLQAQASRLGEEAERIERPADLADALEHATSSLRDALALEQQLVEAYRQALRSAGSAPATDPTRAR